MLELDAPGTAAVQFRVEKAGAVKQRLEPLARPRPEARWHDEKGGNGRGDATEAEPGRCRELATARAVTLA